jgi:hypothetical protein
LWGKEAVHKSENGKPDADGEVLEQLDLADDVVDVFEIGLGVGAPLFEGDDFFFENDDIVTGLRVGGMYGGLFGRARPLWRYRRFMSPVWGYGAGSP